MRKNKVEGIIIPTIKLCYKATVIKTVWYWHKNRHIGQCNRIESSEINPSLYSQLIFNEAGRSIKWSKNSIFNKWCWEIWTATCKKNETRPPTNTIHKNKFKKSKSCLNISCDTIEVLEKNIGRDISDIPHSNIFTDMFPRARDIKERINKWGYIKLKSFYMSKENIRKIKREPTT